MMQALDWSQALDLGGLKPRLTPPSCLGNLPRRPLSVEARNASIVKKKLSQKRRKHRKAGGGYQHSLHDAMRQVEVDKDPKQNPPGVGPEVSSVGPPEAERRKSGEAGFPVGAVPDMESATNRATPATAGTPWKSSEVSVESKQELQAMESQVSSGQVSPQDSNSIRKPPGFASRRQNGSQKLPLLRRSAPVKSALPQKAPSHTGQCKSTNLSEAPTADTEPGETTPLANFPGPTQSSISDVSRQASWQASSTASSILDDMESQHALGYPLSPKGLTPLSSVDGFNSTQDPAFFSPSTSGPHGSATTHTSSTSMHTPSSDPSSSEVNSRVEFPESVSTEEGSPLRVEVDSLPGSTTEAGSASPLSPSPSSSASRTEGSFSWGFEDDESPLSCSDSDTDGCQVPEGKLLEAENALLEHSLSSFSWEEHEAESVAFKRDPSNNGRPAGAPEDKSQKKSAGLNKILNKSPTMKHRGREVVAPPASSTETRAEHSSLEELYSTLAQGPKGQGISSVLYLPPWTINPESNWYRRFRDLYTALSVLVGLLVPYEICFLDSTSLFNIPKMLIYATDVIFLGNFALNFFVPKFDQGEWRTDRKEIAWAYAKGWLWYDLVAAFPWDVVAVLLFLHDPQNESQAIALEALGFTRLLRLKNIWNFLWDASSDFRFNYSTVSLQKFAFLTVYSVHWSACTLYYLARIYEFSDATWIGRFDPTLADAAPLKAYETSLYWSLATLSTVGFGDLGSYTEPEKLWTIFFMTVNLALSAYVVGNMTVMLTKADDRMAEYRDQLADVTEYMIAHQVPESLQHQVQAHLKLQFETETVRDDVLRTCPSNVRKRIARHVYSDVVNRPYLFDGTSSLFRDQLTTHCREEFFLPNVEIMRAGDCITDLYIVASGHMQACIRDKEDNEMQWLEFRDGAVVGEFFFICQQTQLWSVRTLSTCRVLIISHEDYQKLARAHPADQQRVVSNLMKHANSLFKYAERNRGTPAQNRLVTDIARLLQSEVQAFQSMMTQEIVMRLCYAARRGDTLELFRLCAGGFDVNQADYDGRTPLHLAAAYGQTRAAQFIMERGADVNAKDAFHRTPLLEAVSASHWDTAKMLRSFGGELHLQNEGMYLCRLASSGNAEQMKRMLEFGADPDAADYDLRTALHIAVADGHLPVVKVLVKGGANRVAMDRWFKSPVDEAMQHRSNEILEFLVNEYAI